MNIQENSLSYRTGSFESFFVKIFKSWRKSIVCDILHQNRSWWCGWSHYYVSENFKMLIIMSVTFSKFICLMVKIGHQHKLNPTSVTNIDVASVIFLCSVSKCTVKTVESMRQGTMRSKETVHFFIFSYLFLCWLVLV